MAYQSLYRVFRPKTFDEVSGQQHITEILKNQVKMGGVSHAYLFTGPRGTGKTSTARIFANALNCKNPKDGNPCGECEACEAAAQDRYLDLIEFDAASKRQVEDMQSLLERVPFLPVAGKYKVYIIDEVHMLTPHAFNAFLKTLEEPPEHAVFILATTEIRKVPATILSRCQRYEFKRISAKETAGRLKKIAHEADIAYDEDALYLIADSADGALRDAISLLEQCASGDERVTAERLRKVTGAADRMLLGEYCTAMLDEDPKAAIARLEEMLNGGSEPHHILRDAVAELSRRLIVHADESYARANILRALRVLIEDQSAMRFSAQPESVLIASTVRAAVNSTDADSEDLELRVKKLERRLEKAIAVIAQLKKQAEQPSAHLQTARQSAANAEQKPPIAEKRTAEKEDKERMDAAIQKKCGENEDEQPISAAGFRAFQDKLIEQAPVFAPSVRVLKKGVKAPDAVELYADEEDQAVAELLTGDAFMPILQKTVQECFGENVHIRFQYIKEEDGFGDPETLTRELIEVLGADKVEIQRD